MTKISVVMPAYNSEPFLRETLDSVLAQTVQPWEIIVVNDGSTDRTAEILLSYGDRIRIIHQNNQGQATARNVGIREATGDWVSFCDSDDIMHPEKLARQLRVIEANPGLICVYSGFTHLYPDGRQVPAPVFPARELWPALRYRTPILPSTSIVRRDALLAVDGFRKSATEDWDLWFRLIRRYEASAFQDVPESLLFYRQRSDSFSKNSLALSRATFYLLDRELLDGLHGVSKRVWKRKIEARFYYHLSIAFREAGDPRYWDLAIESMLKWPLCGVVVPAYRYVVFAHMLYMRMLNFKLRLRYWWPKRDCDALVR